MKTTINLTRQEAESMLASLFKERIIGSEFTTDLEIEIEENQPSSKSQPDFLKQCPKFKIQIIQFLRCAINELGKEGKIIHNPTVPSNKPDYTTLEDAKQCVEKYFGW